MDVELIINPPLVVTPAGERKIQIETVAKFRELTTIEKAHRKILEQPFVGRLYYFLRLNRREASGGMTGYTAMLGEKYARHTNVDSVNNWFNSSP